MSDLNPVEHPHFLKLCHSVLLRQFARSATSHTPTRSVLAKDDGPAVTVVPTFPCSNTLFACETYRLILSFVLDDIQQRSVTKTLHFKNHFKVDAGVQIPSPMTMTVNHSAGITLCAFCWTIESQLKPLRIEQDVTFNHSRQKLIQYCRRQSRKSSETDHQYLFYPSIVDTVSISLLTQLKAKTCVHSDIVHQWVEIS